MDKKFIYIVSIIFMTISLPTCGREQRQKSSINVPTVEKAVAMPEAASADAVVISMDFRGKIYLCDLPLDADWETAVVRSIMKTTSGKMDSPTSKRIEQENILEETIIIPKVFLRFDA